MIDFSTCSPIGIKNTNQGDLEKKTLTNERYNHYAEMR